MKRFRLVLLTILLGLGARAQAPSDATYITQTPNGTLTAEQALSALATGILKVTTATGVISIAIGADLPTHTHAATDITTSQIALARGGTGSDLSGTGGTGQFLKQSSLGALVTVGTIGLADITEKAALANLTDVTGKKGNSTTVQMFTGTTLANDCAKFDPNGNITSAGGACGLAAPNLNAMTDLAVARTSTTVLTIGLYCSASVPCNVRFGTTNYAITASATTTISAGTGTAYIYVTAGGTLTVGHNVTVVCSGCTASSPVTAFPASAVPLAVWTATSGVWDAAGGSDRRSYLSNDIGAGGVLPVETGGTGLASGTSGGILGFTAATTIASSALLAANGVVLGGGVGATPTATVAGTANQVFRVSGGGGAPAFGSIDLAQSAAVGSSVLARANGGTGDSVLPSPVSSFCSGTATSSQTLFIVLWSSGACTTTAEGVTTELLVSSAGKLRNLRVKSGTAGFAAGSGAVTLRINAAPSAVTCTVGTGTTCSDTSNSAAVAAGDRVTVQFTTQATETLADLQVAFEY